MAWDWNEMFGDGFFFELKNNERKYFGLNEIEDPWEHEVFYSKTNIWYKRTTIFFRGDVIVKVSSEEIRMPQDEPTLRSYCEYDVELKTDNRLMILPLTARGKPKKLTPANVLAFTPTGCRFYISMDTVNSRGTFIDVCNLRNNISLPIGEDERIKNIRTSDDFRSFIEYYISTCPEGYFEKVERMRNSPHVTVKYRVGDIFRIEADRFNYCYGIITGEVQKIREWAEFPQYHSLHTAMMVPLMIRYYELVTPDPTLTADDLASVPLGSADICGDNAVIWGTHTIIDHKEIKAEDIAFNLVCSKIISRRSDANVFTQENFARMGFGEMPENYSLHVEWGLAVTTLPSAQISQKLREYLKDYHSPFSGVHMGIFPDIIPDNGGMKAVPSSYSDDLLQEHNRDIKNELFSCLGLSENTTFDDFAAAFGGLTKAQIAEKIANAG